MHQLPYIEIDTSSLKQEDAHGHTKSLAPFSFYMHLFKIIKKWIKRFLEPDIFEKGYRSLLLHPLFWQRTLNLMKATNVYAYSDFL